MEMISPSYLVRRAARREPVWCVTSANDAHCALCGAEIPSGTKCNPYSPPSGFNDIAALAYPHERHACQDCQVQMSGSEFLIGRPANAVYTERGAWAFLTQASRAYWLLNPPDEPFLMALITAKQQHVLWRAPVNYSRDVFQVRMGNHVLLIRRLVLLEAIDKMKPLLARIHVSLNARNGNKDKPVMLPRHPFREIDRSFKGGDSSHGLLSGWYEHVDPVAMHEIGKIVAGLTPGEIWAIGEVVFGLEKIKKGEDPVVPVFS